MAGIGGLSLVSVPGMAAAWDLPIPTVGAAAGSAEQRPVTFAAVTDLPLFRAASFGDFTYTLRRGSTVVDRWAINEFSSSVVRRLPPGSYSLAVTLTAGFAPVIRGKTLLWNNVPEAIWPCSFAEESKTPFYLQGTLAYYQDVRGTVTCSDPEGTGRLYRGTITDGFISTSAYSLGYSSAWTQGALSSEDPEMTLVGPRTWSDSKTVSFVVTGSTPAKTPKKSKACKKAKAAAKRAESRSEKRSAKRAVIKHCRR